MNNVHDITKEFEKALSEYTNAPHVVCVDNCSNALFMSLIRDGIGGREVTIPSHTYPAVPCEIINAGGVVKFEASDKYLTGAYQLKPTRVWDCSLRFTADMYVPGTFQCLSFTGQWKHLKLCKGGAILTDNYNDYLWFKRYRYSGRRECSYLDDNFDMIGKNYYMPPVIASLGLQLMGGFYNIDGTKKDMPDISLPYPDLSLHKIYNNV